MDPLDRFLEALRPLLREHDARAAYLIGSRARERADEHSDIDVIIVAESDRPEVERFRDYLPATSPTSSARISARPYAAEREKKITRPPAA